MKRTIASMIFFSVYLAFSFQTSAQIAEENSGSDKYTIETCVNEFDFDKRVIKEIGYQYWFVDKDFVDGRTLKMSVVKPNAQTHKPHFHEEDEFFFVIEGKAEFHLNGKTRIAENFASFYCPPKSVHGIRNVGDTELKYLVIKKLR